MCILSWISDVIGGLVGANYGDITDCYSLSSIEGREFIGGLVGSNGSGGYITRSYSSGTINALFTYGGLVGENEGLRLHFSEGDQIEPLVEAIRALPEVIKVSTTDHEILVIVPEAEEALPNVITKANENGVRVRSIDIEEPNLEAVFLHLTGRALRD